MIGSNPNAHIVFPGCYSGVIRTSVVSEWPRCCLVGEDQGVVPLNPAGWNRHIAFAQTRERRNFILSGYEPEDAACAVKNRIRQRHPAPPLVDSSQGDFRIGDLQNRISRYERGGVAVWTKTEMDKIQHRR